MSKVIQDSRILIKASTVSGVEPEIAPSNDHTDGSWDATDVYIRELMANVADGKLWMRMNGGIREILVMPAGATTGDIFVVSGDTFVRIAAGTTGKVLTSNGAGTAPSYETPGGGGGVVLTDNQIAYGSDTNTVISDANFTRDIATSGGSTAIKAATGGNQSQIFLDDSQIALTNTDGNGGGELTLNPTKAQLDFHEPGIPNLHKGIEANETNLLIKNNNGATNKEWIFPETDAVGALASDGAGNMSFTPFQAALGYTPEDVANKQTDLTPSETGYPNVDAVIAGIANVNIAFNLFIELNTATPTGLLASQAAFIAYLTTDNPSLDVRRFTMDGMMLKIEVYGLVKLSDYFLQISTELVSFKDYSGITSAGNGVLYNCDLLTFVDFQYLNLVGDDFCGGTATLQLAKLPLLKIAGDGLLFQCALLAKVNLNSLSTTGDNTLRSNPALASISLPSLITASTNLLVNCVNLITAITPSLITNGANFLNNCNTLTNLIVLKRTAEVEAIETANSITAYVLDLGFTPENVANKATDFTTVNNTLYPSVQAVANAITANALGGTYDPTSSFSETGGRATLLGISHYQKIGNEVTGTGKLSVVLDVLSSDYIVNFSLPFIPSTNFADEDGVIGNVTQNGTVAATDIQIHATSADVTATLEIHTVGTNQTVIVSFSFSYTFN